MPGVPSTIQLHKRSPMFSDTPPPTPRRRNKKHLRTGSPPSFTNYPQEQATLHGLQGRNKSSKVASDGSSEASDANSYSPNILNWHHKEVQHGEKFSDFFYAAEASPEGQLKNYHYYKNLHNRQKLHAFRSQVPGPADAMAVHYSQKMFELINSEHRYAPNDPQLASLKEKKNAYAAKARYWKMLENGRREAYQQKANSRNCMDTD
ncbi:hypothetical protein CBS101457_003305 [Exobasidium rhododendri]|nr:hypothetical protein CBS101457_003305 [Exobasidium rhododendri]